MGGVFAARDAVGNGEGRSAERSCMEVSVRFDEREYYPPERPLPKWAAILIVERSL
nr:hypothetical protein [Haloarcula sp. CBA1131]